jgi:TRAP-type C4-dicarboxylate transport system substrate-binding protein
MITKSSIQPPQNKDDAEATAFNKELFHKITEERRNAILESAKKSAEEEKKNPGNFYDKLYAHFKDIGNDEGAQKALDVKNAIYKNK